MKLEKAIEILTIWHAGGFATRIDDMNLAIQLGIEALKRLDHCRRWTSSTWGSLLPGETSADASP